MRLVFPLVSTVFIHISNAKPTIKFNDHWCNLPHLQGHYSCALNFYLFYITCDNSVYIL